MKNEKDRILFKNTIYLYILTISNYLFNFITVPYQTRVLGPEIYGRLGFAAAFIVYFQLILDFGFILSGTSEVAKNKDNKHELSKIMTSIVIIKFILIVFSLLAIIFLSNMIPYLKENLFLVILYFINCATTSLLPDYLYRGLEDMKIITYRTLVVKFSFSIMIFVFLQDKTQYFYVPVLNIIGSVGAVCFVYLHVVKKLKISFTIVSIRYIIDMLKRSSYYFYSRAATSVYDATNTFILGLLYPSGNIVGYFTSANNLIKTARSGFSPIADSLYPYMIKNKNYKLIKKIIFICLPIIIIFCVFIGLKAEFICVILFGKEFKDAATLLRLLLPLIIFALPNYLLGFPTLSPLGLDKYANISTVYGAIIQIIGLLVLYFIGVLNVYTLCVLSCISELFVLLIRIIVTLTKQKTK